MDLEAHDPEEFADAGRAAIRDIQRASDEAIAAVVRVVEQRTGQTIAVRQPSVMDATKAQLADAEYRARHALLAIEAIRGFFWPNSVETLGEFIRGLPGDVRETIAEHLVKAGLS